MRRIANFLIISTEYQNCFDAETMAINLNDISTIIGDENKTRIDITGDYIDIYQPIDVVLTDFEKALEGYE